MLWFTDAVDIYVSALVGCSLPQQHNYFFIIVPVKMSNTFYSYDWCWAKAISLLHNKFMKILTSDHIIFRKRRSCFGFNLLCFDPTLIQLVSCNLHFGVSQRAVSINITPMCCCRRHIPPMTPEFKHLPIYANRSFPDKHSNMCWQYAYMHIIMDCKPTSHW